MSERIHNVLFLCTGNSARSIIAEAILGREGLGRFRAYSAGSQPKGTVHPAAIRLLDQLDYDTSGFRSKSWDEFAGARSTRLDFVFTVCGNAGGRSVPGLAGPADDRALGCPRSRGGRRQRSRSGGGLRRYVPDAAQPNQPVHRPAIRRDRCAQPAAPADRHRAGWRWSSEPPSLLQRLSAEGLGSFFLFATVVGSGIMAERLAGGNLAVALLGNTVATAAILYVLITMLGPISGAHFNPAVSLVMRLRGDGSWGPLPRRWRSSWVRACWACGAPTACSAYPCCRSRSTFATVRGNGWASLSPPSG